IDAGSMNVVGIKLAIRNEFFHLRNCNLTRHCHQWIEIPRRFLVHEISHRITLPGLHDREVGVESHLEKIILAIEVSRLLSFCDFCTHARRSVDRGHSISCREAARSESALWYQFNFHFAAKQLALELRVLTNIGCNHLLHLSSL